MTEDGESERRLARAVMASPELAGVFASAPKRRLGVRRLAIVLLAVAAGAVAVWVAISRLKPAHESAELDTSDYLSPLETAADPATGEATAPFAGFAVSVESDPPGAIVTVAGVPRGEAPVLAGVDCRPGRRIEVRAEKAGFAAVHKATRCRKDTLVKLTLRLSP